MMKPREQLLNVELQRSLNAQASPRDPAKIWLDRNENTDPSFLKFLGDLLKEFPVDRFSTYPELSAVYKSLARREGLLTEQMLFCAGSDGAIRTVFESLVNPNDLVVLTRPTFAMYPVYSMIFGARIEYIDYQLERNSMSFDLDQLINQVKLLKPKLVCLPNPDSPTGTVLSNQNIRTLLTTALEQDAWVLIDEAYFLFYPETCVNLVAEFENLIVARTFSKAWGLAGLRLGLLISQARNIGWFNQTRPMYEIGASGAWVLQRLAVDFYQEVTNSVERLNSGKQHFQKVAKSQGWSTPESFGNFFHVNFGVKHEEKVQALAQQVLFREKFKENCLRPFCRISSAPIQTMNQVLQYLGV